jgi:hypothetical protein
MLTQQRLRELLDYNPTTGIFSSRRAKSKLKIGGVAGATHRQGYTLIGVDGERFRGCRLAWLYMTGEWPDQHIDHINGDPTDDRWNNLRECSRSENMANATLLRGNNTSGARGVSWNKRLEKWHARVNFEGKLHHCGYFDDFDEAVEARDEKAVQIHGAFAQLNTQEYML